MTSNDPSAAEQITRHMRRSSWEPDRNVVFSSLDCLVEARGPDGLIKLFRLASAPWEAHLSFDPLAMPRQRSRTISSCPQPLLDCYKHFTLLESNSL